MIISKMKKIFPFIVIACLLVACSGSTDEFTKIPAEKPFISLDGAQTRASLSTVTNTFALYGTATDAGHTSIVFSNQKVDFNRTNNVWEYSPLKYWNTQADHTFGAYAPYHVSRNFSLSEDGCPVITDFRVHQDVHSQESLLLSRPVERNVGAGGLNMSPIVFTFDPALIRVNFKIKKDPSVTDALHLNALRMYNLKSSGHARHNGSRIVWDTSSATNNVFGYSTGFTSPCEVTNEGIAAWGKGALMIPQPVSGIIVYLSYTRRQNDMTYSYDKDNITLPGTDWEPGKQITYVLTLKPENYIEIGEPIVEPWIESTTGGGAIIVN